MSARAQQDRMVVALAAVSCGRQSHAESVRAERGQCYALADQYRVQVIEPGAAAQSTTEPLAARGSARRRSAADRHGGQAQEVVLDHWGGDAELLEPRSQPLGTAPPVGPRERARVAARAIAYYGLDSLRIVYRDGARLSADQAEVVILGPRRGRLHRRSRLLRAAVSELL